MQPLDHFVGLQRAADEAAQRLDVPCVKAEPVPCGELGKLVTRRGRDGHRDLPACGKASGGSIHASITAEHAINAAPPISFQAGRPSQTALRHCCVGAQSNSVRNNLIGGKGWADRTKWWPGPGGGGTPPGPGLGCSPGMAPPMPSPLAAEEHLSQYRADEVVWHPATFTHSDCRPERYASRLVEPPPDSGASPSSAAALLLRIFGRTCGLIGSASKSASQRSGVISG